MNRKQRRAAHRNGQTTQALPPATTPDVATLFGAGLECHQAGRLAEAEVLYRQTLAAQPNHPDALQLLGLIASQVGRHEIAVELIGKAIRQNRNNSLYYSNLGLALQALKRFDGAL